MPRATKASCPLSSSLQKQIRRLGGALRAPTEATTFPTVKGKRALPPALAWLHAVEWPAGAKFQAKRPAIDPASITMTFMPVTESYGPQFAKRPFVGVITDSAQFYYFAALDRDEPDPTVYHVDHEGEERATTGSSLSQILSKYLVEKPAKSGVAIVVPDPGLVETFERRGAGLSRASLARIDELYIHDRVKDLTGIEHCTGLKSLFVERSARGLDLGPVGLLPKLRLLKLKDVGDLGWMKSLKSLEILIIEGKRVEVPFASLPKLTSVTVTWTQKPPPSFAGLAAGVKSIELAGPAMVEALAPVLASLKRLEDLQFPIEKNAGAITDLGVLSGASKLGSLWVSTTAEDASPLGKLKHLYNLRIRGPLTSLDFIASLPHLKQLGLLDGKLTSLAPLATSKVDWVSLEGRFADLAPLAKSGCSTLSLASDAMEDLSPLAKLKVKELYLTGKRISDVSSLAKLKELQKLDIEDTAVTDVSPLFGTRVDKLVLGAKFTDYKQLKRLANVQKVSVTLPKGAKEPKPIELPSGNKVLFMYD